MLEKLKWPALIVAGAGGYLAYEGWNDTQLYKQLDASGKVVAGTLESGEVTKKRRSGKKYNFEVSYTTAEGKAIRRTFEVDKSFVDRVVREDEIIEDQVEVKYLPEDPERAIIVGGSKDKRNMLAIGGAMTAVGAILAAFLFLRRRPESASTAE